MPRFVVESEFLSPGAAVDDEIVPTSCRSSRRQTSRRGPLTCLSPDGRTVYSLQTDSIYAHNLPLEGSTEEDDIERDFPAVICTKLPHTVCASLEVDSAVELVCVDGDSVARPPRDAETLRPQQCPLPLLCLYTRHSVFLIQLAFSCPFPKNELVSGEVVSITEPFESFLVGESSTTSIVRVRPAPQRRMGFATLCPPGSMAMLAHDASVNEYTLSLYHGPHQARPHEWASTPLRFGLEQLIEEEEHNTVTDFSFGQSNGQALLATMSVHFLRASGEVLGASPILFDGAVVPRSLIRSSMAYLEHVMEHDTNDTRVRQCCAASQYFLDAFGPDEDSTKNSYVTARTSLGGSTESSLLWPVQIQGPVLVAPLFEPDQVVNRALVMEPFFARDLVGIAIGREQCSLDFCAIPPTALLPRFVYMDPTDQAIVDDALVEMGVIVERVSVDDDATGDGTQVRESALTSLVRDPVMDNTIHYASDEGVVSISTNAMRLFSSSIRDKAAGGASGLAFQSPRKNETAQSTAWSSLDVSAGNGRITLAGAVVSGDAHLGHTLVAVLSDGTPCAVNLTESRYLHESDSLFRVTEEEERAKSQDSSIADEALKAMEATPPFHEQLAPLMDQVKKGLDGMGKIVGGKTAPKDINPGTLATAISVKNKCEKEIVLPLKEMNRISGARLAQLKDMYKSQMDQVASLKETIETLKDRMNATGEKLEVAESNAALLSQRSAAILQASQDLRPTITEAEHEYYQLLKRIKAKCEAWEESIAQVQQLATKLCDAMNAGRASVGVDLTRADVENCHALLHGQERALKNSGASLRQTKCLVNNVASATGICTGNESASGTGAAQQQ